MQIMFKYILKVFNLSCSHCLSIKFPFKFIYEYSHLPGHKPGTQQGSQYEADGIPMCHHALVFLEGNANNIYITFTISVVFNHKCSSSCHYF